MDLQREDFKRLGVFGEWDKPYLTMSTSYEAVIAGSLSRLSGKGLRLSRAAKPVYWCISDKTALAEAEVEYEEHRSRSIYVKYRAASDPAATRTGARRAASFRHHLDHHSVDAARQHGGGLPSRV